MSAILAALRRPAGLSRPLARSTVPTVGTALRRGYSSTMHDNDPEVLEKEKRRNLSKQQHATSTPIKEAPGWNESLASASEAAVKSDMHNSTPQQLQEGTIKYVRDRHHGTDTPTFSEPPPYAEPGVSTQNMRHNGPAIPEAPYTRDEIEGPLKSAHSSTVVETVEHKEDVITRKRVV